MSRRAVPRLPWGFLAAAFAGVVVLLTLGTWQMQRLAWKEALIERLATRLTAEPIGLAAALQHRRAGDDIDYVRVRLTGHFVPGRPLHLFARFDGAAGRRLIHPFVTAEGMSLLVDRGFVPDGIADGDPAVAPLPAGEVSFTSIVRTHVVARGLFTPDNEPAANRWYWWDLASMAAATGLAPADFAGIAVEAEPAAGTAAWPRATPLAPSAIANRHLQYALTWYALAIVLAVMAFIFAAGRARPADRQASNRDDRS